jgi:hypothetical protein
MARALVSTRRNMRPIDIDAASERNTDGDGTEAAEFPLKTDHLVKGSVVSVETIEEAFQVGRDARVYQLAILRASEYIAQRFADRGEVVFVAQVHGSLRVLTDEEAPAYGAKLFREGMRKAGHAHARQAAANRAMMSAATLAIHDRDLEVQGRMLAAATRERRSLTPKPTARQTPRLKERRR